MRRGQQRRPAGLEHPADSLERRVRVHQMLDQLAHDHDIGGLRRYRKAGRIDPGLQHGQADPPSPAPPAGRPVTPHNTIPGITLPSAPCTVAATAPAIYYPTLL